jgi:hypothetical protein
MEDLLAKFYGKPALKGSSPTPVPDESAPQSEPEPQPQHNPQLEQRVSHIESQLQEIAETQQTILSRLDQAPEPAWRAAWHALRKAWKEFRPEPGKLWSDDGTPLRWDSVHRTLHIMDDASEARPPVNKHSDRKIKCTCTICGRRIGLRCAQMARATLRSPESIHCP